MKTLPWLSLAALAILCFECPARGQEIKADLTGDGVPERIAWTKFAETKTEGEFYQLKVYSSGASLLWEGPATADPENPLVFGSWHFGISLPEVAADIDGDGNIELLAPAPVSDVSPVWFRILRWTNGRFSPVRQAVLLESPNQPGTFPWSQSKANGGTWISSFEGAEPNGRFRVKVFRYNGGSRAETGVAVVEITANGFRVVQWNRALQFASGSNVEPAPPTVATNSFRARLSAKDHVNSDGARLTSAIQVLRQDRANFYRGRGDAEDEADPYFSDLSNREKMENLNLVPVGKTLKRINKLILTQQPLVRVTPSGKSLEIEILEP